LASIDLMAIVGQARRDGLHRPRIAVYDAGPSVGRVRLTCPAIIAVRIQRALERAPAFTAGTRPSRTTEVTLPPPPPPPPAPSPSLSPSRLGSPADATGVAE